jgi:hypothetical protein
MLVIEIGQPHHLETNPFGLRPSAERSDRRLGARSFLQIGPPLARRQTFIEEAPRCLPTTGNWPLLGCWPVPNVVAGLRPSHSTGTEGLPGMFWPLFRPCRCPDRRSPSQHASLASLISQRKAPAEFHNRNRGNTLRRPAQKNFPPKIKKGKRFPRHRPATLDLGLWTRTLSLAPTARPPSPPTPAVHPRAA